jgi:hypothetical protein
MQQAVSDYQTVTASGMTGPDRQQIVSNQSLNGVKLQKVPQPTQ